jgi:hypothetical protein
LALLLGTRDPEYVDDPANWEIYDVNTIANYDPDIIPLLDSSFGSAFERPGPAALFVPVELLRLQG